MRTPDPTDPFCDLTKFWHKRGRWPASWITHPQADGASAIVMAFRCDFSIDSSEEIQFYVSADERYELWLDGKRIGRGPERGDRLNWFFETYRLSLQPGTHRLVARVWCLGDHAFAPLAQLSTKQPAFLVAGEGRAEALLSTGIGKWETKRIEGCKFIPPAMTWGSGCKLHVVGSEFSWNWETGGGDGWTEPRLVHQAFGPEHLIDQPLLWQLRAGTLPAMYEKPIRVGIARHVQPLAGPIGSGLSDGERHVRSANHIQTEADQWTAMFAGRAPLIIPPRTRRRVIVDLRNYYCAYTDCVTTGGRGAVIQSWWAESLYEVEPGASYDSTQRKGNRDEIEGKTFVGIGDTFEPDGGRRRLFSTLWWEAGRYLQIVVETADEPLTIESFSLRETHYPYQWDGEFSASDERLGAIIPLAKRTLEMCTHETFMDCPYYEQLMYVGDTRLEVLASYTWSSDDRMPRKALRLYDESRRSPGFTQSRYPSRLQQTIPPFSVWWIAMLHDFMMWRGDHAFVAQRMAAVRSILDAFDPFRDEDGLIAGPPGWNFLDWVPTWKNGMPVDADYGVSAGLNLQLAWVTQQAAELEAFAGHPELAALNARRSGELKRACNQRFWSDRRGLYADDLKHTQFSEHAQCLALLGNTVPPERMHRVTAGLLNEQDLARTTIYFSHYLFETLGQLGRIDRMIERMDLWFWLKRNGLYTTLEAPEPSRSDCHAWAAHPLYHYTATILGIRPADAGFKTLRIHPQLGPLRNASGAFVHDRGPVKVAFEQSGGRLSGTVELPAGLTGVLVANGERREIIAGTNRI